MALKCTICNHPRRKDIEAAIAAGVSNCRIASNFLTSEATVRRHIKNCIKPLMEQVVQEQRAATKQVLATALERVQRDVRLIDEALVETWGEQRKDAELLLKVLGESRQQNKLLADLTGEGKRGNIFASPEWQELVGAIFSRLAAHPEAHRTLLIWLEEERAKRRSA